MEESEKINAAAREAAKLIAEEALTAAKVISAGAKDAVQVIATAAAEALRVSHVNDNKDHDLLIELRTQMLGIKDDIRKLSDGTTSRICDNESKIEDLYKCKASQLIAEKHEVRLNGLEITKANADDFDKHEDRIVDLENSRIKQNTMMIISGFLLTAAISLLIYFITAIPHK